ncbi:hypothetical protein AJ80_00611 [Polytolypa hystricis UAMH7299]|uniref:FAD/NAD(P)-binding domain-containing protein n=1 Tax=Polytolypa hystricis (strain UAMH7299) TaxID=1447883 RepID=A0A2B7Z395_POLH7|nr:hypothetical protein AJ80_00611 [Polytolypa hystricis UAMH7299]
MADPPAPSTVAVIGLGALGLVALKNLLEEGFDATGYDKNSFIGGLWQYVDGPQTSVLESTVINISKERGCYTDFPFPEDVGSFATGEQVAKYLDDYTAHFSLADKIHLNTDVLGVTRGEKLNKWEIELSDKTGRSQKVLYDKVVLATGINKLPCSPDIPGIEKFKGDVIHSVSYKRPTAFKKKKVLIIGLGNTAADTATTLVGHADKIYISHRHGAFVIPRIVNGKPLDHGISHRMQTTLGFFQENFPTMAEKMITGALTKMQNQAFTLDPEWKFSPAPPITQSVPIISDNLIDELRAGHISSVGGLKRVIDGCIVELEDGTQLEVDSIIFCTGYKADFSILGDADPSRNTTRHWAAAPGSNGKPLPRLYRNIFSLDHPDSLAIMGALAFMTPAFQAYDLASMAVAQVWRGNTTLPSRDEMNSHVDEHHEWVCSLAARGSVYPGIVKAPGWMKWVNDAAGTGVNEYLGYGLAGWWYWCRNFAFCRMLMTGLSSPHVYRLFETGKRKTWSGAREAIDEVNKR